nr:unnamed protein product [Callosobruchus chinensis]
MKQQHFMSFKIELSHELSAQGIKPLESHIKVIQIFRVPKTIDGIEVFLGLLNFVGKLIVNVATLTEPLRKILRLKLGKNANNEKSWKEEQSRAFMTLKEALINTLGYYDPKDKTQVIADASPMCLGGSYYSIIIVALDKKPKPCARMERWVLRLQSFDIQVIEKPGKTNIADPLSRLCQIQQSIP